MGAAALAAVAANATAAGELIGGANSEEQASKSLGRGDLVEIARLAKASAADPFSKPISDNYDGRAFALELQLSAYTGLNSDQGGLWKYDLKVQKLELSADLSSIVFSKSTNNAGNYIGTNALGVSVRVAKFKEIINELDFVNLPSPSIINIVIPVDPNSARAMTTAAKLLISGHLTAENGALASCSTEKEVPTLLSAAEIDRATCSLAAKLDHVAFASAETVFREWSFDGKGRRIAKGVLQSGQLIEHPDWVRRPNGDDMARYYPDAAQRNEVDGEAVISCTVTDRGGLTDCSLKSQTPDGMGFGEAALRVSRLFRMNLTTLDGDPVVGGKVVVPMKFQVPQ